MRCRNGLNAAEDCLVKIVGLGTYLVRSMKSESEECCVYVRTLMPTLTLRLHR